MDGKMGNFDGNFSERNNQFVMNSIFIIKLNRLVK